jgi:putative tryptophan/tyrosine transport system substrate-binding protein
VDRRAFVTGLGAVLAAPLAAEGQQPGKVPRIGHLSGLSPGLASATREAFLRGLNEVGYVEGRNILIEWRWADGRFDRLPDLAAELVQLKVDVIVVGGQEAAFAAAKATRTVPIVFLAVSAPADLGLILSVARPGGNVTGVSWDVSPQIYAKRLELLKEIAPKASRIALVWNPNNPNAALLLRAVQGAARALGVELQRVEVRVPEDFESAFVATTAARPDALLVAADPLIVFQRNRVTEFAARNRLPAMYGAREFVIAGGSCHMRRTFLRSGGAVPSTYTMPPGTDLAG